MTVDTTTVLEELQRYYDSSLPADVTPGPGPDPGTYTYSGPSMLRAAPSQSGMVTMAGPQDNPATMWISVVDGSGTDQSARLARVVSGSVVRLDQVGDATKWQEYVAVGPGVAEGNSVRFDGIVHWNQGTLLDEGAAVVITGRASTAETLAATKPAPRRKARP